MKCQTADLNRCQKTLAIQIIIIIALMPIQGGASFRNILGPINVTNNGQPNTKALQSQLKTTTYKKSYNAVLSLAITDTSPMAYIILWKLSKNQENFHKKNEDFF